MSSKSDLEEYLDLFELTATKKEIPRADWTNALLPLLNDKFRSVVMKLKPEARADYTLLKTKLQDHDDSNIKQAASTFWTLSKKRGWSALQYGQQILRLTDQFMEGEDRESFFDCLSKERLIQEMPKGVR